MRKTVTRKTATKKAPTKQGSTDKKSKTGLFVGLAGIGILGWIFWKSSGQDNNNAPSHTNNVMANNAVTIPHNTTPVKTTTTTKQTNVVNTNANVHYYSSDRVKLYKSVVDRVVGWWGTHFLTEVPNGTYVGKFAGEKRGDMVKLITNFSGQTYTFWADEDDMIKKNNFDSTKSKSFAVQSDIQTNWNAK